MHYVVGDTHGCLKQLIQLLKRAKLVDKNLKWIGGTHQLWFLGDYTDRGPDGIGVINLIMQLEKEAKADSGAVNALLGNHDVMLLAAHHFSEVEIPSFKREGQRMTFFEIWRRNGGQIQDFEQLRQTHIEWLSERPALALAHSTLLMHADSLFYLELGNSLHEINSTINTVMASDQYEAWDMLLQIFSTRLHFAQGSAPLARAVLERLGGSRIVHGHTPIYGLIGVSPHRVKEPLVYADGLVVDVDHCIWNGGPGFVLKLPSEDEG